MHKRFLLAVLALITVLAAVPAAPPATATNTTALRNAVTVSGVMAHEREFQRIANQNRVDGVATRSAGTAGYNASVDYVAGKLRAAGYNVRIQNFTYDQFRLESAAFEQVSPTPTTYTMGIGEGDDFFPMDYTGAGDVTRQLVPTSDIQLRAPGAEFTPGGSTSGCEPQDYPAATAGNVALVQRGTCPFRQKGRCRPAGRRRGRRHLQRGKQRPER